MICSSVNRLGFMSIPSLVMDSTHFWRRSRGSAHRPRAFELSAHLRDWLAAAPKAKGNIKLDIDVDPQSFLCGAAVRTSNIALYSRIVGSQ
jgi:primosomal protein N' (replication factor Y)